MKQMIKNTLVIVALLLVSLKSVAAIYSITYKIDGNEVVSPTDFPGDVTYSYGVITITPYNGYYFSLDDTNDLIVIKVIDGQNAQTRTDPGINKPLTITPEDATADPSKETKYTFSVPGDEYDYEITANFHTRTSVDNATVEVVGGPFTYSGSSIMPDLTVTVGGKNLTKDTDYKAYYKDSINAGTGKVIINGIRKYNGLKGYWGDGRTPDSPAATYTINKAEISPKVTITGWTYGSPANAPEVKEGNPGGGAVSYQYKVTSEGNDTYTDQVPTAANNYTVKATVAETDNYKEGTATATFTISPKTIANATITLTPESFVYNGENQKPTVSVKDGDTDLVLDQDYTLTNEGGTNVGTYTVTIKGKGNYDSSTTASKDFSITALEKTPTVALANPDEAIIYDGTAKEPALSVSVVIKDGDFPTLLTLNTDYTVVYSDNVNAGTNTAKATVTLKGNYKGTGSVNFTIAPKSIANVSISDIAAQPYTGSAIEPTVTVKDGDKTLVLNTDYTISYSNNTDAAASTAENAPTVTITGKGNYDPNTKATKTFTIGAKSIANATITLTPESFTYNGQNQKPVVNVKDGDKDLVLDTDYTLTNEGGTNAGTYTVTITGKGNYDPNTKATKTFTIGAKSIANATITLTPESFTYNGQNQKPTVSVKDGDKDLVLNTDYTVTNDGGTNVGEYSVTITGKGNYDSQTTASKKFNITVLEKTPTVALANPDETIIYDGKAKEPAITVSVVIKDGDAPTVLTLNTDYTVVYSDNVNAGTNTAKATVTLKGNYKGTATGTFTITPKSIANATITLTPKSFTYNGQNQKPTVSVKDGDKNLVLDTDYTVTNEGGTNVGTYTVTITGKGNYDSQTTASKTYTITKANASIEFSETEVTATIGETFTEPTLTKNKGDGTITYSSSDTKVATVNESTGKVTLVGAGTATIKATMAASANYNSAEASYQLTVKKQSQMDITVEGFEGTYDGKAHGIKVTVNSPKGAKVEYREEGKKAWSTTSPTFTEVGTYVVEYRVTKDGYETYEGKATVNIIGTYPLWINDTQVSVDNKNNILNDDKGKMRFFFEPKSKRLIITNNQDETISIKSELDQLIIYMNGKTPSKLDRIYGSGKLKISTFYNIPGKLILETTNEKGAISGFSELTIDETTRTILMDPTDGYYANGSLLTAEGVIAQQATIGQYVIPFGNEKKTFPVANFLNPDGTDKDLSNTTVDDENKVLFTANTKTADPEDNDGYDAIDHSLVLNTLNKINGVTQVSNDMLSGDLIPGSDDFANNFHGVTFMVPDGEGDIYLDVKVEDGYALKLKVLGDGTAVISEMTGLNNCWTIHYNVDKDSYVLVWLEQTSPGTRIGKREKAHGHIYSIAVAPTKASKNPLNEIEDFPEDEIPEVQTTQSEMSGIINIPVSDKQTDKDDRWYTIDGQQIKKPTQKGIYIHQGKKVVIK